MNSLLTAVLHGKSWKAYCISLPRCTDRRQRFQAWADSIDLSFTFWDATDKQSLPSGTQGCLVANKVSLGATACRKSYELLFSHILSHPVDYVFILEDDAGFKSKTWNHLIEFLRGIQLSKPNWDILQFGFGTMTGVELHLLYRKIPPGIFQANFTDQTHANLYTRDAIIQIQSFLQEPTYTSSPIDGIILKYIQKKKAKVLAPSVSILEQTDTISYIQQN
jgi:GR25 family glycosyltransferase involved in LPS biosynthesis